MDRVCTHGCFWHHHQWLPLLEEVDITRRRPLLIQTLSHFLCSRRFVLKAHMIIFYHESSCMITTNFRTKINWKAKFINIADQHLIQN